MVFFCASAMFAQQKIGTLSKNPYAPDSTANPTNRHKANSVTNPYGQYGGEYSPNGAANPYATDAPKLYAPDGTYLGKVSANRYDPDSISNPYGKYGSKYSPTSVNNPYGKYGSPYSSQSATNPYATQTPIIVAPKHRHK